MRGPPTPIVMVMVMMMVMFFLLCGQIAHPFGHRRGPIPLRWHQTCQSGTKRTERTNKPSTVVSSPTLLRTSKCARLVSQKEELEQNTIHKTEFADQARTSFSENYFAKQRVRVDVRINMLQVRYISQRPTRCAPPRTQFKQQNKFCNAARISVLPSRYTSYLHMRMPRSGTNHSNQTRKTWPQQDTRNNVRSRASTITIPLIGSASPRVQSEIHMTASDQTRNSPCGNPFAKQFATSIAQHHLCQSEVHIIACLPRCAPILLSAEEP